MERLSYLVEIYDREDRIEDLSQENDKLRRRLYNDIEEFKATNIRLYRVNDELQRYVNSQCDELEYFEQQLHTISRQKEREEERNYHLTERISTLEKQRNQAIEFRYHEDDKYNNLQHALNRREARIGQLQDENSALQNKEAELFKLVTEMHVKMTLQLKENERLREHHEMLTYKDSTQTSQISSLSNKLVGEKKQHRQAIVEFTKRLNKMDNTIKDHQDDKQKLKILKLDKILLQQECERVKEEVQLLRQERDSRKTKATQSQEKSQTVGALEQVSVKNRNQQKLHENESLHLKQNIEKLRHELTLLREANENLERKVSEANDMNNRNVMKRKQQEEQNKLMDNEKCKLGNEIEELRSQLERSRNKLETKANEYKTIEKQLKDANAKLKSENVVENVRRHAEISRETEDMRKELATLRQENNELRKKQADISYTIKVDQTEGNRFGKEKESLSRELAISKKNLEISNAKLQATQRELEAAKQGYKSKEHEQKDNLRLAETKFQLEIEEYRRKIQELNTNLELAQKSAPSDYVGNRTDTNLKRKLENANEELRKVQRELDETKTRLSSLMGQKLTDNNPNIADLSDKNRPTKLAERYSELYDNQWTDAFELIDKGDETETIQTLKDILEVTRTFCKREADEQLTSLKKAVLLTNQTAGGNVPNLINKQLKDCRKAAADASGDNLYQKFLKSLSDSGSPSITAVRKSPKFLRECFDVCWLMSIQDPPVVFGANIRHGETFDTDVYKAYTKSGPKVDYIVWPAMYLYDGGAVLCKGIAQGRK